MMGMSSKSGFFAGNSDWIRPLIAAVILLIAPNLALTFTGMDGGYIIPLCSGVALVALVVAGLKARLSETLVGKLISYSAVLAGFVIAAAQLLSFVTR